MRFSTSTLLSCMALALATGPVPAEPGETPPPAAQEQGAAAGLADDPCASGNPGPVRVQIGSVEAATEVGKEVPVPVRVKGVCDLGGFKFGINLDRGVAELVAAEPTEFLRGVPPVDTDFYPATRERYVVAGRRPEGAPGVDGVGTLVRLVLRGRRAGSTQVELLHLQLFDSGGERIESFAVPLRLTVMPTPDSGWKPYSTPKIKKPSS